MDMDLFPAVFGLTVGILFFSLRVFMAYQAFKPVVLIPVLSPKCPVCATSITHGVTCQTCTIPYHSDCAKTMERSCGIYGCQGTIS